MATIKTAISVPASLYQQMDRLSKRLRVPRSQLFSRAVAEFLDRRRTDELTEQINRAYAKDETAEETKVRRAAAGEFRRLLESDK